MARRKGKDADSRAALLEAAWQLLVEQGASGLLVEAIVSRAVLSKGTFFHFFPAKQDLLDALCTRIADESAGATAEILARADLDPVARLDGYLRASRAWRFERPRAVAGLWLELARDENATLLRRVTALGLDRLAPVFEAMIREGVRLGVMNVSDPEATARLVVEWMTGSVDGTLRLLSAQADTSAVDLALRRANATLDALERVLGLAAGSLTRVERRIVNRIARGVPRGAPEEGG